MSGHGATLLVIDDEAQIRKFLRISLSAQGYQVVEAGTGRDGLAQAALTKPDLVVLDLGLPDMDGKDVLAELREWSQVPVLVLSVRASEGEKVLALDGGANDYVTKPFDPRELVARINAVLRRKRSLSARCLDDVTSRRLLLATLASLFGQVTPLGTAGSSAATSALLGLGALGALAGGIRLWRVARRHRRQHGQLSFARDLLKRQP